jgi:hypothetical protein
MKNNGSECVLHKIKHHRQMYSINKLTSIVYQFSEKRNTKRKKALTQTAYWEIKKGEEMVD